jgi:hypothetical protein
MMPKPLPSRRASPAVQFRAQIERAEAEGLSRAEMTLRLTPGDASLLKRDRNLALADISFGDGVMRYLDVRVVEGGVVVSELVTSG